MGALGSLFDGSGGFPLAGALSGITPLWASEIEPYPIAVTTSRFPQMKHLGNVAEVDGRKIPPVDIITFGSPCQDMSVAGKRVGMKHREKGDDATTRSGLFYEAIRVIQARQRQYHGCGQQICYKRQQLSCKHRRIELHRGAVYVQQPRWHGDEI